MENVKISNIKFDKQYFFDVEILDKSFVSLVNPFLG